MHTVYAKTKILSVFIRVSQGFWVYSIQGFFQLGIQYIIAEIWVFGVSLLKFQLQSISTFPELLITYLKIHEISPDHVI